MTKINGTTRFIIGMCAFFITTALYATTQPKFTITPTPSNSNIVHLPTNGSVFVNYNVTNNTAMTRTLTMQPINGVIPLYSAGPGSCANPFTLAHGESCVLSLQIKGSLINNAITGPKVCATQGAGNNTPDPFLCSQPSNTDSLTVVLTPAQQSLAYIANNTNPGKLSLCPVNPDGTFQTCSTLTDPSFLAPDMVLLNSSATIAYVQNNNPWNVSVCPVNASGTLGPCSVASSSTFNFQNTGMAINNGNLYLPNCGNGSVSICPINTNGSLDNCTLSTGNGSLTSCSNGIAFNRSGAVAYIPRADGASTVISICPVAGDGNLGTCTTNTGNGTFNTTLSLTVNPAGTTLYVVNGGSNSISICPINTDGSLGTCSRFTDPTFHITGGGTANPFSNGQFLFIPNAGLTPRNVVACPIINTAGALGPCSAMSDSTFVNPQSVWVLPFSQ